MRPYDYLIVGAGLYGATFARLATDAGKRCLVIDKRDHIAGNCYDVRRHGILVNKYGGHIFHTNSRRVWEFVNRFASFSDYIHRVAFNYKGQIYPMPEEVEREGPEPENFEDYCIWRFGREAYETIFRGYTIKQWNRSPRDLPASIAKRIRVTADGRYFDDRFQGMPVDGYTAMVERMLDGIEVELNTSYPVLGRIPYAEQTVFSGPLDALFDNRFGPLEYRSLGFSHEVRDGDFQGCATVNYTDENIPFTRIIEWRHFRPEQEAGSSTVITREFPATTGEPYYPVGDAKNTLLYKRYRNLVPHWMMVGGRLGSYQYLNMDQAIAMAMKDWRKAS